MPATYTRHSQRFDDGDEEILQERMEGLFKITKPVCGDWVIFADGKERRISYIWDWSDEEDTHVQTSDGGSWYFGGDYCSFSGSLYVSVPGSTLTDTGTRRDGWCWFFHHDWAQAHNGVDVEVPFRVWRCSLPAPRH